MLRFIDKKIHDYHLANTGIIGVSYDEYCLNITHLRRDKSGLRVSQLLSSEIENIESASLVINAINENSVSAVPVYVSFGEKLMPYTVMRFKRVPEGKTEFEEYVKWQYQKQYCLKGNTAKERELRVFQLHNQEGHKHVGICEVSQEAMDFLAHLKTQGVNVKYALPFSLFAGNLLERQSTPKSFVFTLILHSNAVFGLVAENELVYGKEINLDVCENIHLLLVENLNRIRSYAKDLGLSNPALMFYSSERDDIEHLSPELHYQEVHDIENTISSLCDSQAGLDRSVITAISASLEFEGAV